MTFKCALEAIEDALDKSQPRAILAELTSKFYTIIPHSFGRQVPPVIADKETLQKKFDMLLVRFGPCFNPLKKKGKKAHFF